MPTRARSKLTTGRDGFNEDEVLACFWGPHPRIKCAAALTSAADQAVEVRVSDGRVEVLVDEVLNSVLEQLCSPSTLPSPLDVIECWAREALDVPAPSRCGR